MGNDFGFAAELKQHTQEVEAVISSFLPPVEGYQKQVIEAMHYSFLAGGKRLRPMLMLETCRLFHGNEALTAPFMAALEMIHTYSLIHDDLPAMDNDEYRRGRKTTHIVYGEAMAILAGDALLNFSTETALKAFAEARTAKETNRVIRSLEILCGNAGIYGMLGGQVVDVESEGLPLELEKLDFIYELKTGALIESAMLIGAVLAGADASALQQVKQAAHDIGLAFQIQDDILDVIGNQDILGKPIGSDEKNQKTTYVTIRGLEQSARDVEVLSERAIALIEQFGGKDCFLSRLTRALIHREK